VSSEIVVVYPMVVVVVVVEERSNDDVVVISRECDNNQRSSSTTQPQPYTRFYNDRNPGIVVRIHIDPAASSNRCEKERGKGRKERTTKTKCRLSRFVTTE